MVPFFTRAPFGMGTFLTVHYLMADISIYKNVHLFDWGTFLTLIKEVGVKKYHFLLWHLFDCAPL